MPKRIEKGDDTAKGKIKRLKGNSVKTEKSRKALIKECDVIASQIVRLRDGKCCACTRAHPLFCHHIFSRSCYALRFDLRNLVAICWACHRHVAHEHPEKFRDIIIGRIGEETYLELKRIAYSAPKNKQDLEAIKAGLITARHDLVAQMADELGIG